MIRYLGKRYDVLMSCISFDGSFTCTDIAANPRTVKSLANDGYLNIIGGEDRRSPYLYSVPDKIRQYYAQKHF